jgi:hypothetical protein
MARWSGSARWRPSLTACPSPAAPPVTCAAPAQMTRIVHARRPQAIDRRQGGSAPPCVRRHMARVGAVAAIRLTPWAYSRRLVRYRQGGQAEHDSGGGPGGRPACLRPAPPASVGEPGRLSDHADPGCRRGAAEADRLGLGGKTPGPATSPSAWMIRAPAESMGLRRPGNGAAMTFELSLSCGESGCAVSASPPRIRAV